MRDKERQRDNKYFYYINVLVGYSVWCTGVGVPMPVRCSSELYREGGNRRFGSFGIWYCDARWLSYQGRRDHKECYVIIPK